MARLPNKPIPNCQLPSNAKKIIKDEILSFRNKIEFHVSSLFPFLPIRFSYSFLVFTKFFIKLPKGFNKYIKLFFLFRVSSINNIIMASSDAEKKAHQKLEEGEKKLKKSGGFFSSILGNSDGVTDAVACFVSAANSFKAAKNWSEAGKTFLRVAELLEKQGDSKFDAAQNFGEAGICYRKVDLQKAVDCYQKSAEIYVDMGRFNMAAKAHMTMAELYEATLSGGEAAKTTMLSPEACKEKCMTEYQKSADYYKGEEQRSSAAKCLVKVAAIAAELEQYQRSMHTFEEVAIYETENQMLKYSAKTHFFQALLASLCFDLLDSQRALKRYEELCPQFKESRECKLIQDLMHAMEIGDPDGFTDAVQQYDKISRLDNWHVQMLVKIKRHCGDGGEVRNDEAEDEDDLR